MRVCNARKNDFLIFQSKHMLRVLKRTVSMRRFFEHRKHYTLIKGQEILTIFAQNFVYLNLCLSALAEVL